MQVIREIHHHTHTDLQKKSQFFEITAKIIHDAHREGLQSDDLIRRKLLPAQEEIPILHQPHHQDPISRQITSNPYSE